MVVAQVALVVPWRRAATLKKFAVRGASKVRPDWSSVLPLASNHHRMVGDRFLILVNLWPKTVAKKSFQHFKDG